MFDDKYGCLESVTQKVMAIDAIENEMSAAAVDANNTANKKLNVGRMIIAIALVVVIIVSCFGVKAYKDKKASEVVGTWKLAGIVYDGTTYSANSILEFREDGTMTITNNETGTDPESTTMKWVLNEDGNGITLYEEDVNKGTKIDIVERKEIHIYQNGADYCYKYKLF